MLNIMNISINREVDITLARIAAGELAEEIGFNTIAKHCIITSVSELAANIYFYPGKGIILLKCISQDNGNKGIEVIASDEGMGIENIQEAMKDGYSTNDSLGGGLPGVKRLMSEMEISSTVGRGTVVRAVKWIYEDSLRRPLLPVVEPQKDRGRI